MVNYAKVNKNWWNSAVSVHATSKLYNLSKFKKGFSSLQSIETKELGNVSGKTLLHLMCHFGMDTLSWAKKGAIVTGIDISEEAIMLAKKLSDETKIPAEFICSDVYNLENTLHNTYDVIFMSYGVLMWLSDIERWASLIYKLLKKGGTFYLIETHPFTNMITSDMQFEYNYFDKGPYVDDASGTYADWNAKIGGKTYVWFYTISDVINVLLTSGLTIEFVHEFPFTTYEQFPGMMKKDTQGHFVIKDKDKQIPLLFSIKATK